MIRLVTDIKDDGRELFYRILNRERFAMKSLAISLSLAFAAWMSAALMLAYFSREVAEFIVGRM